MIKIAITRAAFNALAASLPLGSMNFENEVSENDEIHVWRARSVVDRLKAMRGPGESYSDVILRLVELEGQS
jgi:hypothetical protein